MRGIVIGFIVYMLMHIHFDLTGDMEGWSIAAGVFAWMLWETEGVPDKIYKRRVK